MFARLYYREFHSSDNVPRMLKTIETHVNERIVSVNASLTCLISAEHSATMLELWEYPDKDSMNWVRQSLQGATIVPDSLLPETTVFTLTKIYSHGADWNGADWDDAADY